MTRSMLQQRQRLLVTGQLLHWHRLLTEIAGSIANIDQLKLTDNFLQFTRSCHAQ